MPLDLTPVSIEELPKQERRSKWRDLLEQFAASNQPSVQVTFEGETGRDDKPLAAGSVSSGLSTARSSANGEFEHISIRVRGDAVYLVNKNMVSGSAAEDSAEDAE